MSETDRSIDGTAKTVSDVLENKKYSIDYYQREYKWEAKQLAELVADLTGKFLELYDPDHVRRDVANYPGYYLGSIIISQKGRPYIVDGQQRLTSLTLLLIYLHRLQQDRDDRVDVEKLIFSEKFGEKSFNLDVADRRDAMEGLFESGEFDPSRDAPESVRTLGARYGELESLFPDELRGRPLPFFIDWLKDRVQLVQITAYADDDAYAIFETMNDRGLKLSPADMLKGYLLSNTEEGAPRNRANETWRKRLRELDDVADDAGSDFLKTWLRSQYATKIRERRRGARPEDWDRIGTEFHRWLRGANARVGLRGRDDFYRFVVRDLDFYGQQYERILRASTRPHTYKSPLRFVRYNADQGFTLQYQLLLSPLRVEDGPSDIETKLELVGRFVDILLAWRIWNFRATAYSTMQYAMFNVMRDIRGLSPLELAETLHAKLLQENENFESQHDLSVHQQNRRQLHRLLARVTDYITVESGMESIYDELTNAGSVRYEVEHIWANRPERHLDEFSHAVDFSRHRNRIGDLLLLPKQFNASYGDDAYDVKSPHYFGQNLLAASLNSLSYEKNPGFMNFIERSDLPFKSYDSFKAADIDERGELYRQIAKRVWSPEHLLSLVERAV